MLTLTGYRQVSLALLAIFWLGLVGGASAASHVTIVGTVFDGYQVIDDDGQPYEVENTENGNDLVLHHVGRRVEVTGTDKDEIDYKVIIVDSFRLIEE